MRSQTAQTPKEMPTQGHGDSHAPHRGHVVKLFLRWYEPDQVRGFGFHLSATLRTPGTQQCTASVNDALAHATQVATAQAQQLSQVRQHRHTGLVARLDNFPAR